MALPEELKPGILLPDIDDIDEVALCDEESEDEDDEDPDESVPVPSKSFFIELTSVCRDRLESFRMGIMLSENIIILENFSIRKF